MWSAPAIMREITLLEPDEPEPLSDEPEWCSWRGEEGAPIPSAWAVAGPTTPSAVSPCAAWKCFTAAAVWGPNETVRRHAERLCTSSTELLPELLPLEECALAWWPWCASRSGWEGAANPSAAPWPGRRCRRR